MDMHLQRVSLEKPDQPDQSPEGLSAFIWKVKAILKKSIIIKSQSKKEGPTALVDN